MTASSNDLSRTLFARRGWLLAALFLIVLAARALMPAANAPLRPEWLIYVAAAIVLRLWAGVHLGGHGNDAQAHAPRLARTGPYRLSRNPLYIANILAAAGLILFANALPLTAELALIAVVALHHILLVHHEETTLRALHGEDYARYSKQTPRWYGLLRSGAIKPDAEEMGGTKDAQKQGDGGGGNTLSTLLRRQGRNTAYMVLCVFALWMATLLSVTNDVP